MWSIFLGTNPQAGKAPQGQRGEALSRILVRQPHQSPTLALGHLKSCSCQSPLLQLHQNTRITSLLLRAAPSFSTSLNQAA